MASPRSGRRAAPGRLPALPALLLAGAAVTLLQGAALAESSSPPADAPVIRVTSEAARDSKPDVDLYALMSGKCNTLRVDGRSYPCKAVAYFHSETGRANFTVAVDDPRDHSHIISFSGDTSARPQDNLYELAIDRLLLNSADRPKVDGLPVPFIELSAGVCRQIGNFAARQVSTIYCAATARNGKSYEFHFESDGTPVAVRRVRLSAPTIKGDPYR